MPVAPKDNGRALDQFNDQLRMTPIWQDFMRRNGQNPARVSLSDQQRKALRQELMRAGYQFPNGMEIDPAGNVNQNQNPAKKIAIGAGIGAGALTGLGALGIGPMSGLFGGGGAAASAGSAGGAAAGGVLPSSHLPVGALMGGAPAIVSQGVSQSVGTGLGAGAAGAAGAAAGKGIGSALADAGKGLLSPGGLASLAPLIAALANGGGATGGFGEGGDAFLQKAYADAQRDRQMQQARYRRVDPLHEAVTQLAFNRLPISARHGINLPRVPMPD